MSTGGNADSVTFSHATGEICAGDGYISVTSHTAHSADSADGMFYSPESTLTLTSIDCCQGYHLINLLVSSSSSSYILY